MTKIDYGYVVRSFGLELDEVISHREYDDRWVLVTRAGRKLVAEKRVLEAQV